MAISFPFFNGWNNWTESEVEAAIATSGRVLQTLWQDWPAAESSDHVEVYNVNVRSLDGQQLPPGRTAAHLSCRRPLLVIAPDWSQLHRSRWGEDKKRQAKSRKSSRRQFAVPASIHLSTVSVRSCYCMRICFCSAANTLRMCCLAVQD